MALSIILRSSSYWPEMLCWSNGRPSNWLESSRGKEGIDLSVVLGDQLIPIVCASTDSPMCLIWYGLFLLSQDKGLSHHFPLWPANQIKSKGMTACGGVLPRLWLADHNKGRPSIRKGSVCRINTSHLEAEMSALLPRQSKLGNKQLK